VLEVGSGIVAAAHPGSNVAGSELTIARIFLLFLAGNLKKLFGIKFYVFLAVSTGNNRV